MDLQGADTGAIRAGDASIRPARVLRLVAAHRQLARCASEANAAGIRQGDWAVFTVSDDGEGMDRETRRRAFEPFFTTRRPSGSGLGLAAVHGIARAQNGGIQLESAPGVGTSCRVYLRLEGEEPGATPEAIGADALGAPVAVSDPPVSAVD